MVTRKVTVDAVRMWCKRYRGKISGPLLDRIDIQVQVNRPPVESLRPDAPKGEASDKVASRVDGARKIQLARSGKPNAHLSSAELSQVFQASRETYDLLESAMDKLSLSARAYQRVQRVARTIADLAGEDTVATMHVAEALRMRQLDRTIA